MIGFIRNVGLRWAVYAAGGTATFLVTERLVTVIPEAVFVVLALLILLGACVREERSNRRRRGA